ncbi:MAG: SagB/ThcOx family dehydrogenase [Methylophilaceae bacterium]|nr:SagB/ThcOx family dehydrogenase [Methylophilaceae bacterium]
MNQTNLTRAEQAIRTYHKRTKHRFEAYAPGPDTLDWDAQPAPFRHFDGAPNFPLPALADSLQDTALLAALTRPFFSLDTPSQALPYTLLTLGALLHLALGITAWKSYGPDRWAVRANPSSGNLHPIEAYVLIGGLQNLPDGIYHYRPETHALERRANLAISTDSLPTLQIALSAAMWREAWKYGERAFRYCQLDTGHAVGALAYAARVLGWSLIEQRNIATDTLAQWLGLNRSADFPARRQPETEREEAEMLLAVSFDGATAKLSSSLRPTAWVGVASTIDAHPMYRWPIIEEVAVASRHLASNTPPAVLPAVTSSATSTKAISTKASATSAADIILGRRSAQRFNANHVMPRQDFLDLLIALLPCQQSPWNALSEPPRINLLLFVHRVEGFDPGLYLFVREPRLEEQLNASLNAQFLRKPVGLIAPHLNLQLLTPAPSGELHRVTRSLHCHQDIAANACFALGMLAEYDGVIANNPAAYRDLHREAGLIGQVLYLQAEAHGLRGTGIGCFFDDPIHDLLGLSNETFQTIYHFTVGLSLEDTRIENIPTYTLARTS